MIKIKCQSCGDWFQSKSNKRKYCNDYRCNATHRGRPKSRRGTGGWSKHGGGRQNLEKEQLEEWACQSCGQQQTKDLPQYMIPLDDFLKDFLRICSRCQHIAQKKQITQYSYLIKFTRRKVRNTIDRLHVIL